MSDDTRQMLLDTLERVLTDHCTAERVQAADAGGFDAALWQVLEELGYPLVAVPEEHGGIGLTLPDQCALLRLAGRHCAPQARWPVRWRATSLPSGCGCRCPDSPAASRRGRSADAGIDLPAPDG